MNIFRKFKKHLHKNQFSQKKAGFTIVETVVAVAILAVSVVAPLTLAQRSLNADIYARDQVTAFYLAQEAVEYVRNIRDGNGINSNTNSTDWLFGLSNCMGNSVCGIDPSNLTNHVTLCTQGSNDFPCQLVFDPITGIYKTQTSGAQGSIFRREVKISPVSGLASSVAADVTSTVSWKVGKIDRNVVINARIFNWYQSQ